MLEQRIKPHMQSRILAHYAPCSEIALGSLNFALYTLSLINIKKYRIKSLKKQAAVKHKFNNDRLLNHYLITVHSAR